MACTVSREIFVEENANKHLYVAFTLKAKKLQFTDWSTHYVI